MASTQISITLSEELASYVRARVASGQYASASEVVRDGIEELIERDDPKFEDAVERWLRTEVVAAYDAMKADPSRGRSIEDVRARLAREHDRAITGE